MKVFITVFNRVSWLIPLCEDFVKAGCEVVLIDNNSTYPPLLEWYKKCPYVVHRLRKNHLAWAFFTTDLYELYKKEQYFIISDSDMDISRVPRDFVSVLKYGLHTAEGGEWKCALAYELDDLPENQMTDIAKAANAAQWINPNGKGYFRCATDLGIAMYDRSKRGSNPTKELNWFASLRTPRPYVVRHLDWYVTPETLREEDKYYIEQARYYSYLCLLNEKVAQNPIKNQYNYKPEV